jgi:O-antigen/teichoic acid export membrane protein
MAMAGLFVYFLATLNELGLGAALVQKHQIDETTLRQVFGFLLLINFCLFLFVLSVAPLIAGFFNEERIIPIIRLLSIQFVLSSFTIIPQSILTREMDFKKISVVDFVSAIAGSVVTLILAMIGMGVWSLVWGSVAISVGRTIAFNVILPFLHLPRFSFRNMAQSISFGSYVTIERILWFFYSRSDTFIIGKVLGNELLGFYSVSMDLASLPMEKVSGLINQVAFPAFSRIQTDTEKVKSHFLKAVRMVSFFAFPVLWGMSSIAPELIAVLLGDKWRLAAMPFQLLSLIIPIRMVSGLMPPAVIGLGRPDVSFLNVLVASLVMPVVILIGSNWGIVGVSLAWVIFYPLVVLINLIRVMPVLGVKVLDVLLAMARPALSSFTMYIAIMVMRVTFATEIGSIAHLVLLIIGGAIVYGGMLLTLDRHGCREVVGLMRTSPSISMKKSP